ncbi:hypothetical protein EDE08_101412 [Bradyrhizobium sp. R2.2-H]|jgi:hypothetical protein|uniref:hypothetical protein n=1 Tax=unclassified Bradyrhizobium TaxID=2631580 RepID=UPI001047E9EE|nr:MULTISPECIES: hypothetical protein [unclassified Bradyrhizobium]TCU78631.1 hypothetical protein EDE10_101413 [Bradyrhizobium sp. Y-H1]TCU80714.1 hypothetical protein EDE08_101412 [Bradyrhizobium sp. R2.2-H]
MHHYIARANVDHYIALLNGADLMPDRRSAITKLLISEADGLGHDLEQLEFFENRAAAGRKRVETVAHLRDGFAFGTPDRRQAEEHLVNIENLQTLLEDACHRLRRKINSRGS